MNKKLLLAGLVLAQLSVPAMMIASQERILEKGALYHFRTAPVDPYDIFRGRYVRLGTAMRSVDLPKAVKVERGQTIYLVIERDEEGFAAIKEGTFERPKGVDYIKAKVTYGSNKTVHFNLPLDRYYMNEKKAPEAERVYRNVQWDATKDTYIKVRLLNGNALIEGLYIEEKPIEDYLQI